MMKIVYFLSFLVFCQAISDQPPQNVKAVVHQGENNEIYFVASWDKVESTDDDPIVGYKEKPITEVAEFEVSADKTEYTYHDMKKGVLYQVAVQAYSAKNVGPLSNKKGFSFF